MGKGGSMTKKEFLVLMVISSVLACLISYLYAMGIAAMFGELLKP